MCITKKVQVLQRESENVSDLMQQTLFSWLLCVSIFFQTSSVDIILGHFFPPACIRVKDNGIYNYSVPIIMYNYSTVQHIIITKDAQLQPPPFNKWFGDSFISYHECRN